jgi:hypothetical protein
VQVKPEGNGRTSKRLAVEPRTSGKLPPENVSRLDLPQPEPLEVVVIDVQLSCVPPSAHLLFRGRDYPGVAMLKLEPGSYSFECQYTATCPECGPLRVPFSISRKDAAGGRRFFRGLEADAPR